MVPTKRMKTSFGVRVNQIVEYRSGAWTAIDVVAQRDENIVVTNVDGLQERLECGVASVDVTDSKMACQFN